MSPSFRERVLPMGQVYRPGRTISSIPVGYDRNGRRIRVLRKRRAARLRDCLAYPLIDGPGVALLFFLPPFLTIMAMPALDLMVHFKPGNALNPVYLLIIPFSLPLAASFTMTVGYILLFLGRVLSYSALGDEDHPRWPKWDRMEILEELARWTWAGLMGISIGGFPAVAYWISCGKVDTLDLFLFFDLAAVGVAYAQLALVAALLHESMLAANPATVLRSVGRIGWDYLRPCLLTTLAMMLDLAAWAVVLTRSPSVGMGVLGLWACWVLTLYLGMVIFRVLGVVYNRHAEDLDWFGTR